MFRTKTHKTMASLVVGVACLAVPCVSPAASPVKLSGAIAGTVRNASGVPQMGATVVLYNRQDRNLGRVLTDEHGEFRFPGLLPETYSIKVTLAAFLPARKDILVQPGMRSVLAVNLNTLFSSIRLAYPPIENGSLVTDDWKWVLRSASSTRPVLRYVEEKPAAPAGKDARTAVFSDTRYLLRLSAGEGVLVTGVGNEADLGTAFALATSLYGNSSLQVSGNVGYGSQTGMPSAAIRTSYSRNMAGGSPEFSVTMRQLFMPVRTVAMAGSDSLPMLRSMSASFDDRKQLAEHLKLQYGFTVDSVTFVDRLNYYSPYGRLSYAFDDGSTLDFAYTTGNARPDLAGAAAEDSDLQRDLNTLGMFPAISLRGGRPKVQRGNEYELTYTRKAGSRTYSLSAYRETVSNSTLTLVAPAGLYGGDILPDLFSGSSIFNAGNYDSAGVTAAMTQSLGDHVNATVMYGTVGGLTVENGGLTTESPDELRAMIREGRRQAATGRVSATVPHIGTHLIASYQWTADHRWAVPGNLYSTQSVHPVPGLNVYVRQPIPGFSKRIEATADFRNLLAQGYLPLGMVAGQRIMLVQTPRSLRGGLSFIF